MGEVFSLFSIVCGRGKFINGEICDRIDALDFVSIGLIGWPIFGLCV
jgi:sugar phosphate permease